MSAVSSAHAAEGAPPGPGVVAPATAGPDRVSCPSPDCWREEHRWIHAVGARYDVGSASAYGLGYMVGHVVVRSGYPDAFFFRNLGLGLDGRAVTRDHGSVDALVFSLAARASAITGFGGLGAELLAGVGEPRHGSAQGLMSVGFFWSLYALEAGYSYQFPLTGGRADWMSSHQFSVRINVPFYRQDKVTTDHPR